MLALMLRHAWSDLKASWLESLATVLVLSVATAVLAFAAATVTSPDQEWQRRFDRTEGAHVMVWSDKQPDLSKIARLPMVQETAGPFQGVSGTLGVPFDAPPVHLLAADAPPAIARPKLVEGRWPASEDEILLEYRLFDPQAALSVGAKVRFSPFRGDQGFEPCASSDCRTGAVTFTVSGVAEMPVTGMQEYGRAEFLGYVSPQALSRLSGSRTARFSWLGARLNDPNQIPEFRSAANAATKSGDLRFGDAARSRQQYAAMNPLPSDFIFFGALGTLALIAACLVIGGSVRRRLSRQPGEVGILKAIGLSPVQVAGILTGRQILLGLAAGLVGWAAAAAFSQRVYPGGLLWLTKPAFVVAVLAVVQLIIFAMATTTARRAGREPVVAALRNAPPSLPVSPSRIGTTAQRLGLSPTTVMAIRQAVASPTNALRSVAALSLSVATMATAFGFFSTNDELLNHLPDPYAFGTIVVHPSPTPGSSERLDRLLDRQDFVAHHNRISRISATRPIAAPVDLKVVKGKLPPAAAATVIKGRAFTKPGEALAGRDIYNTGSGLDVGERARITLSGALDASGVRLPDRQIEVSIVGLTAEGLGSITVASETVGDLGMLDVISDVVSVTLVDGVDPQRAKRQLEQAGGGLISNVVELLDIGPGMLRPTLYGMSALLMLVGICNVIMTTAQTIRENEREFAILKALGFTPAQIGKVVTGSVAIVTIVSVIVGTLIGTVAWWLIWSATGLGMDALVNAKALTPWQTAAVFAGSLLVALTGATLPARNAARLRITPALRSE